MRDLKQVQRSPSVSILTGGGDRPYALGLAFSLVNAGVAFEFVASDFLESRELRESNLVRFLNLRGNADPDAALPRKIFRVLRYYARLLIYASRTEAKIFHVLWNNKFELLDRTLVLLYYRALGKRVVHTVHNVNIRKRDGRDTWVNRVTLHIQYKLCDHLFVHTELMKRELMLDFRVDAGRISVIPFGINSTVPRTDLSEEQARRRLGLSAWEKVVLFYGNIAPYKGLEYLVEAVAQLSTTMPDLRLVIAGRPKGQAEYWKLIERRIEAADLRDRVTLRIEYISDEDTEVYFKAADVLALPYLQIFQSGVLFLGYNFGLPAVATDVGALADDVEEGRTGYIAAPADAASLRDALLHYFESDLYRELSVRREEIRKFAADLYSWDKVAAITRSVYQAM